MATSGMEKSLGLNSVQLWRMIHNQAETIQFQSEYIADLEKQRLASNVKIRELEFLRSCITRVGEGVHVSHSAIMNFYHKLPDRLVRGELSKSRFARK